MRIATLPTLATFTALLLLGMGTLHCGARSTLSEAESGTGGSSTTTTTTTTTSTGTGGDSPGCAAWEQTAEFRLEPFDDETALAPRLTPILDDQSRFALTLIGKSQPNGFLRFWHTPVSPWSPPDGALESLDGTFIYHLEAPEYAVAPSATQNAYALLVGVTFPPGVTFDPAVSPGAGSPGLEVPFLSEHPGSVRPLFVARRWTSAPTSIEHLLGYEQIEVDRHRLLVRIVSEKWGTIEHSQAAACANAPIAASGVGTQSAFYIASATSRGIGQCEDPADPYDAPRRLVVSYYNQPLGEVLHSMAEWEEAEPIEAVELVLGEGALWVAYSIPLDMERSRIRAARVGLTGGVLVGPFDVADVPRPAVFSAAQLKSRLAIASRERTLDGRPIVPVRILEPTGELEQSFTLEPEAEGEVAIAGEPNGKRLLVALTRRQAGEPGPALTLARYGCL